MLRLAVFRSGRLTAQNTAQPHPAKGRGRNIRNWPIGVCTTFTLRASDRVVLLPDRAGFRMFPRVPSVCGGGNAVRVQPRARVFPVQGLVGL